VKSRHVLLFAVFGSVGLAADLHVLAGAGGAGTGADWTNAFTTMTAAETAASRGDTIWVGAGTYSANLTLDTATSDTTLITIKAATVAAHGSATGWSDAFAAPATISGFLTVSSGYWVFDGVSGSDRSGYGLILSGGISVGTVTSVTFTYCEMRRYAYGTARGDMTATGNIIDAGNSGVGLTIRNSWLHNVYGCPILLRSNDTVVIEDNLIEKNRSEEAYHAEGLSDNGSDNVIIRRNRWLDIDGTAFIAGVGAGTQDNWQIYNNVFAHPEGSTWTCSVSGVIVIDGVDSNTVISTNWKVYNNTIATINGSFQLRWNSLSTSNIDTRNNLIWQNRPDDAYTNAGVIFANGSGHTNDYNYYGLCAFPFAATLGAHENAIYNGANCALSDAVGFPGFVDPDNGDYRLAGHFTTYARTPLGSPYDTDITGVAFTVDIGAYEFTGTSTPRHSRPGAGATILRRR